MKALLVKLTDPNGVTLDLTGRLGEINTLTEGTEDNLLDFVHGDIDLELNDYDGAIEALLAGATAADEYTVDIYRETALRRPKWDLVFSGLLDLPGSVTYDRKDKRVSLQVFANTKLLERGDADSIKRDIGSQTGNATASGFTVTALSDTSDLQIGDTIRLESTTAYEENTVASIDSSSQITCSDAWSNSFTAATFTLETPYYRRRSIEYLADLLFTEAGISAYDISIDERLSGYPIRTAVNIDGVPVDTLRSITDAANYIKMTYATENRAIAQNCKDGFADGGAHTDGQGDWRPYMDTEPSTIRTYPSGADDGQAAFDHTNSHYYDFRIATTDVGGGNFRTDLYLRKDAADLAIIDTYTNVSVGYAIACLEYDVVNDEVWVSFERSDSSYEELAIYSTAGVSSVSDFGDAGQLRSIASLNLMAWHSYNSTTLTFYDLTTRNVVRTMTCPRYLLLWTMKHYGDYLVALYHQGVSTRVIIYSTNDFSTVADYKVSDVRDDTSSRSRNGYGNFLAVYTFPSTRPADADIVVGCAGSTDYFVLSPYFDGVVDYADFTGQSCSAALTDLATACGAFVTVDQYRHGYLKSRLGDALQQVPDTLSTPLERTTYPISDWYKDSVRVTGEDSGGSSIEVFAGDRGESARRLEIGGALIYNESLATAIGNLYYDLLSRVRSEERVEVREGSRLLRPLDQAILDDVTYLVVSSESDIQAERQQLRLVEFVEQN